jgi:hypothetical protein
MRHAYFISTIELVRAMHPPASIEDFIRARPKLSITLRKSAPGSVHGQSLATTPSPRVSVLQKQDTGNAGLEQNIISNQYGTLCKSDCTAADSTLRSRLRSRDVIESEHPPPLGHDANLERDHKRLRQLVVVDLTESDSEEEIKSEPVISSAPLNQEEDHIPPEQKMRDMLQNKKVSELKDILAKREGQIPA